MRPCARFRCPVPERFALRNGADSGTVRSRCQFESERFGDGRPRGTLRAPDRAPRTLCDRPDGAPDHVVQGANAYEIELLIRSRLGGVRGYGKSAKYETRSSSSRSGSWRRSVIRRSGPRPVTVYIVTKKKGFDAIRTWMKTPTEPPHLDDEILRVRRARPSSGGGRAELVGPAPAAPDEVAGGSRRREGRGEVPDILALTLELQYFELVLRAHLKWLDGAEKALKKRGREERASIGRRGRFPSVTRGAFG